MHHPTCLRSLACLALLVLIGCGSTVDTLDLPDPDTLPGDPSGRTVASPYEEPETGFPAYSDPEEPPVEEAPGAFNLSPPSDLESPPPPEQPSGPTVEQP